MAGKDKKGKGKSFLVSNAMEALGSVLLHGVGKEAAGWLLSKKPEIVAKFGDLPKNGLVTQLIPYLLTLPIKDEVWQDSLKGLFAGAVEAFSDGAMPDDPSLQKDFLITRLEESMKKRGIGLGATSPKAATKRSFADAYAGMDPNMRKLLKPALDAGDGGLWDVVDWLSAGVDLSSKELEGFALMGDPAMRLINHLLAASPAPPAPPVKAESFVDKVKHRIEKCAAGVADKYLDPHGKGLEEFAKKTEDHAKVLDAQSAGIAKIFGL